MLGLWETGPQIVCTHLLRWNCRGKGHLAKDFPSPKQGSAGSFDRGKKKSEENHSPGGSANVATPTNLDGAWSIVSLSNLFDDDDVTDVDSVYSVESMLDITSDVPGPAWAGLQRAWAC